MTTWIDTRRIERDACVIAGIPAPNGLESDRLAWLEARLADAPGIRWQDDMGNLVWELAPPPYQLALLTHVDTVFDTDTEHHVVERDGWLCGPSIGDNSLAVAVTADVVERLAVELSLSLVVVFTVGEEGLGNLRGARHACAGLAPDRVIALEGHGIDTVYADAVGSLRARLEVTGPGGHSWWDRGRPSATHALACLVARLLDESSQLAVNVGRLAGGGSVNAIAASAEALLEGRSLDEADLDDLGERLRKLAVADGLSLHVEMLDRRPSGRLRRDDPLLAAVLRTRTALGLATDLSDGSTDANAAHALGIPAIGLGCARGADMHSLCERIERASIGLGVAQLEGVLRQLLINDDETRRGFAPAAKGEA